MVTATSICPPDRLRHACGNWPFGSPLDLGRQCNRKEGCPAASLRRPHGGYLTESGRDDSATSARRTNSFPAAFAGTMGETFKMTATGVDVGISRADKLLAMRLVEHASDLGSEERRTVAIQEVSA